MYRHLKKDCTSSSGNRASSAMSDANSVESRPMVGAPTGGHPVFEVGSSLLGGGAWLSSRRGLGLGLGRPGAGAAAGARAGAGAGARVWGDPAALQRSSREAGFKK